MVGGADFVAEINNDALGGFLADAGSLGNISRIGKGDGVADVGGCAQTEASGNVDASNVASYADLGVDFVSCGALTHSAPILDLSLKHLVVL